MNDGLIALVSILAGVVFLAFQLAVMIGLAYLGLKGFMLLIS